MPTATQAILLQPALVGKLSLVRLRPEAFGDIAPLAVVTGIVSLPISIGGHGVREGAFIVMFAAFGIISIDQQTETGREPAIVFSVLFFALLSVWSLVGGVVYLMFPHADGRGTPTRILAAERRALR